MGRAFSAAVLAGVLMIAGCGYHPVGAPTHLNAGVHTLAIPVFQNATQSYHTEVAFTQAVTREFSARTAYRLVAGNDSDADATLDGTITAFQVSPLTYNPQTGQSSSFLITVRARVKLVDRNNNVLYQNPSYLFRQQYETTQDLASFIQEDNPAVQRLARDFAQSVVSDILESF